MSIPETIELFDSGRGGLTTNDDGTVMRDVELRWLVNGCASYMAAENRGNELAPLDIPGHRRKSLNVDPLGNGWYVVSAQYANPSIQDSGGDDGDNSGSGDGIANTVSFDTTGGTEHVTQSYNPSGVGQTGITGQLGYARPGQTAQLPDFQGAIGVSGNTVNGVDKVVPVFNFQETWAFPSTWVLDSYVTTLHRNTGKLNLTPFRVFDPGEVLFQGARAEITRGSTMVSITFSFSARPNIKTKFKVGAIEVLFKGGWDYMDVIYEDDTDKDTLIKRPKFVFINTIYDAFNFGELNIGTRFPRIAAPTTPFTSGAS